MRALVTLISAVAVGLSSAAAVSAPAQAARAAQATLVHAVAPAHVAAPSAAKPTIVYRDLALPGGRTATVFSDGVAEVFSAGHRSVEYRMIMPAATTDPGTAVPGTAAALPGKDQLTWELSRAPASPYLPGTLEVVLAKGVSATSAERTVPAATLATLRHVVHRTGTAAPGDVPAYTTSGPLNHLLAGLGTQTMSAAFRGVPAQVVAGLGTSAGMDLGETFAVHVTDASVPTAVAALLAAPGVAYAAPDWTVAPMNTQPIGAPAANLSAAASLAGKLAARRNPLSQQAPGQPSSASALPALPSNFALQTSEQALLNRPGVDWAPAYEALQARYHQLPGTGETITNVSLGDLDSAGIPGSDPCSPYASSYGPTTVVRNGQRYLDLPSMPLIPTWTASAAGTLDPTGEVCGVDPYDTEIGLDFSMMAPLPDGMQRAGETGSGLTDLLGIAPGASYRLVVPSDTTGSITSVDEALLAAAQQSPRPDVITASLGFGLDSVGFPARYLEDDPVTESLIAAITHQDHIIVSVASGDGLRTFTNAAVGPSGGAAPTDVTRPGGTPTSLADVEFSGAPSSEEDSGSIDAGGVTLDDIFAAPPRDETGVSATSATEQRPFPEVRWDGSADFASGFGPRVNVSAPADDVIAFSHAPGGAADAVSVVLEGGTSAAAPEIAAAAAVTQQAARLSGDQSIATDPLALRSYLARTGSPVAPVSQADRDPQVGPQVDLGAAVTRLLASAGYRLPAGVARVGVAQRQPLGRLDQAFLCDTDPAAISMAGSDQNAPVTIAPDWTGLPAGASYRLYALSASGSASGSASAGRHLLATGPTARLRPAAILAAAGLAPSPQASQSVSLSYVASFGQDVLAQVTIPLTFTPVSGAPEPLAPVVDPVVHGSTITVHYDLTGQTAFPSPELVVSPPGRVNPTQLFFWPVYSVPLTATSGTVRIPVSALQGDGVYGIGIQAKLGTNDYNYSDFAVTRVATASSDVRPPAPLLSASGSPPGHLLTIGYGGSFTVSWNVRGVPGAAGAMLEISAAGPNDYGSYAGFNNPNGSVRDHNGHDLGSVYYAKLPGTAGSITLTGTEAGLDASLYHNVRVIPTLGSGAAAGEASDISTITMNGVTPDDGGQLIFGYGINASGSDGFLTSNRSIGNGQLQGSVETFSQSTQAITGTVAAATGAEGYTTIGIGDVGMFAGDTGLYGDITQGAISYDVLHPVSTGTAAGKWTPPAALVPGGPGQLETADNQDSASDAMFSYGAAGQAQVFTTNVGADTFGPVYSIASAVQGFGFPFYTGTAEDTKTDTAVVAAYDIDKPSAGPTMVTVNLANGDVGTVPGVGGDNTDGLAADPQSGTVAGPEIDGIGLYDLGTGSGTFITPGGSDYQHPADDPGAREYLVEEVAPPGSEGAGQATDNNSISAELVISPAGQVLKRIEKFQFFNVLTLYGAATTQLNPATRTAYTLGLDGTQLEPFSY